MSQGKLEAAKSLSQAECMFNIQIVKLSFELGMILQLQHENNVSSYRIRLQMEPLQLLEQENWKKSESQAKKVERITADYITSNRGML